MLEVNPLKTIAHEATPEEEAIFDAAELGTSSRAVRTEAVEKTMPAVAPSDLGHYRTANTSGKSNSKYLR